MGFFSKKKKEPVVENPYANPITPYEQARNDIHQQSIGGPGASPGGLPSNPRINSFGSSTAPPPYQSPASTYKSPSMHSTYQSPSMASDSRRFGEEKFGNQNGYGNNRYDNNASAFNANQSRTGGYGGLGDDASDQQLFGNAQARANPLPPTSRQDGPAEDDEYGGYGAPRELTEEEREEQGVQDIKDETKAIRREGVEVSNRFANQANDIRAMAASVAARTASQGERLHRTNQNMNTAAAHTRIAEGNIKTLVRIDGSMLSGLAPHRNKTKEKAMEAEVGKQISERDATYEAQRKQYEASANMEQTFNGVHRPKQRLLGAKSESRKDFTFENDSEDEMMENKIDENVEEALLAMGDIKKLAIGIGQELDSQIQVVDEVNQKTDLVDDRVRMNRERLKRFH